MPRQEIVMPRGKRPPRAAAANSAAINVLLGKRNIGPALGAAAANLPGPIAFHHLDQLILETDWAGRVRVGELE